MTAFQLLFKQFYNSFSGTFQAFPAKISGTIHIENAKFYFILQMHLYHFDLLNVVDRIQHTCKYCFKIHAFQTMYLYTSRPNYEKNYTLEI